MATRSQNEIRFKNWMDLSGGGRRYWCDRLGVTVYQRIIKVVDIDERTIEVVQEIYTDDHSKTQKVFRHGYAGFTDSFSC